MKKIIWLAGLAFMCACTDEPDGNGNEDGQDRGCSKIELTEVIPSDSYDVTSVKTFSFDDEGINSYVSSQEISGGQKFSYSLTTSVAYSGSTVTMSDDNGNVMTYTLDANGYAGSCIFEEGGGTERRYSFGYFTGNDGRRYLQNVSETIEGEVYSSLELDYSVDGRVGVEQTVDGSSQTYIIEFDNNEAVENKAAMPDMFLSELYPLSLHLAAYYGGIIGNAYEYLCTDMYPEDSPELNEHTSYSYSLDDDGYLSGCKVTTNSGGSNYVRNITVNISSE